MEKIERPRKIMLRNFYGDGKRIHADDLGWRLDTKKEAGSVASHDIFNDQVVKTGLNLAFYNLKDDTSYGIHREQYPIECKVLPRDRSEQYLGWQCSVDTYEDGKVIASFDDEHDIWNNLLINGESLEAVLRHSYIMVLY